MDEQQLIQEYMAAKAAGDEAKMDMLARQLASSGEATAGDVTRAVGQGLTLGGGDELEAGVRSIFDDRDSAEIRDEIRCRATSEVRFGKSTTFTSRSMIANRLANCSSTYSRWPLRPTLASWVASRLSIALEVPIDFPVETFTRRQREMF